MIPLENRTVAKIAAGWLLVSVFLGETEMLGLLPTGTAQGILAALTLALLAIYWRVPSFREWANRVPVAAILAFHTTRFVGFYFLKLYADGELPYSFAVPGGRGDIAVATAACLILLIRKLRESRAVLLLWNTFGLADILYVVLSAGRALRADPRSLDPLLELPLSFLPTFVVPIIIASHVILFCRLYGEFSRKKTGLTSFFAKESTKQMLDL